MFVSLFIALVLFRLIAAGAGESFSALDLNPGGSSAAFSFSIFRACVCLALEGLWQWMGLRRDAHAGERLPCERR